jgi:chromosome segregation ATPase
MSNQEFEFRSATFGGFNRDDVTRYIKTITEEHRESIAQLEQRLAEVTEEKNALAAKEAQSAETQQRVTQLEEQLSAERENSAQLQEQISELQAQNQQLREEEAALQDKLKVWAPSVTTYGAIKNQMAEIELNARERSALLLQRAEEQAESMKRQSAETVAHSAEEYDKTRVDVNQTLNYLIGQLQHIQGQLRSLSVVLDSDGKTLFGLQEKEEENG